MKQKRTLSKPLRSLGSPFFWMLYFSVEFFKKKKVFFLSVFLVFVSTVLAVLTISALYLRKLSPIEKLQNHTPSLTTKIFDRSGVLLYKIYKDENRSLVSLKEVAPSFLDATIAIEDKDFYSHHGVSLRGIARALVAQLRGEPIQGGSTITQQLVKNTLLTRERTYLRKIKEIILALRLEQKFSKDMILQLYINESAYGGSIYGVSEAALGFFGKNSKDLTIAQSAYLAGLPQAPSLYNPFGSHSELGKARQLEVLRRMFEDKKISQSEYEHAQSEKLAFISPAVDMKAPHFVQFVKEQLAQTYGEDMVAHGGLQVTTTLDYALQKQSEDIVSKEIQTLERLHITNGAALVTNPKTGEILAMIGSRDYFDATHDGQVNVTLSKRQPGSSIKPVIYATALERGYTPSTIIDDAPISYSIPGSDPYTPQNYDSTFHGKVTLRTALANSYNIPSVKTLASVGLSAVIQKGRDLGISSWDDPSRFGLSLALGAGEVTMMDMASVYGVFAAGGIQTPLQPIKGIKDSFDMTLYTNPCTETQAPCGGKRVLDERIAYQITNILSDNTARSRAFGPRSVLYFPKHEVAVKTGTTNSLRDNWTDGYTSDRVVITWVGNNDNTPMNRVVSGIIGASPIWNKIITLTLPKDQVHQFHVPQGLYMSTVCRSSGRASCTSCESTLTEYFLPGSVPEKLCTPSPTPWIGQQGNTPSILDGRATQ